MRRSISALAMIFYASLSAQTRLAPVTVDSRCGYTDASGWKIRPQFEHCGDFTDGFAPVKWNGKYGYIDPSGTLIVAAEYDEAEAYSEELAAVRKGDKWGYIDLKGNVAIAFRFDVAQKFLNGSAVVTERGRLIMIDRRGAVASDQLPSLDRTYSRLQAFEVSPYGDGPLDLILPIQVVYKAQLRELALRALKSVSNVEEAKAAIEKKLAGAGIRKPIAQRKEQYPYGKVAVEIVQAIGRPNMIAVIFHLSLADSSNSSVTLYAFAKTGAAQVYRADSNFEAPWGAEPTHFAAPQFTRPDAHGESLMLLSANSPRSGNGGYGLTVELLRINTDMRLQKLFAKQFAGRAHQIAIEPNGFRLETLSMEHDVMRGGYRVYPYRYEIRGDVVARVAPIGFDAHDFVGEWGNLPWAEAAQWSDPAALDKLHAWFEKLRDKNGYFGGQFQDSRICYSQGGVWEVPYSPNMEAEEIYFVVERRDKWTFMMKDILREPTPGCAKLRWVRQPFQTMFEKPLVW